MLCSLMSGTYYFVVGQGLLTHLLTHRLTRIHALQICTIAHMKHEALHTTYKVYICEFIQFW